jgi:soluble lytic murein transglycosylase
MLLALGGAVLLGVVVALSMVASRYWQLRARTDSYDRLIREAALRHGIAPGLVKAVIWKESRFQPYTVGRAKEVGLMQITAGAVTDWQAWSGGAMPTRHMCFDPGQNIEIGTWYLARAMRTWRQYRSADVLALAEYNAGGSRARRWAPTNPQQELEIAAVRLSSTRDYISQVRRKWYDFEQKRLSHG